MTKTYRICMECGFVFEEEYLDNELDHKCHRCGNKRFKTRKNNKDYLK